MMNGMEYTGMEAILAGSFRAAIYCRLSKDDDLDGESASMTGGDNFSNSLPIGVSPMTPTPFFPKDKGWSNYTVKNFFLFSGAL